MINLKAEHKLDDKRDQGFMEASKETFDIYFAGGTKSEAPTVY